jgi:hypothetical protein
MSKRHLLTWRAALTWERGLSAMEMDERRAAADGGRWITKLFYVDDEILSL